MTSTPDRFREWDAAYVLGALSAEDRHAYERHLPGCPACAAAVAELAGMPGILAALPAAEALAIDSAGAGAVAPHDGADRPVDVRPVDARPVDARPTDPLRAGAPQQGLVRHLARAAVKRSRRTRIRVLMAGAAAAAVIALASGALGASLAGTSAPDAAPVPPSSVPASSVPSSPVTAAQVVAMQPVEPNALTASLTITDTDWGTRFDWSCVYLNELWKDNGPQEYDMVMTDLNGASTVLATWTATSATTENLAASTDVPRDRIRSIEIRAGQSGLPLAHSDL